MPDMLSSDGADNVYPPSEDTHLLMDSLASEEDTFKRLGGQDCLCLEIGIGSGAVSQMLVEKYGVHILGVDVNSEALSYARNTLSFSQADLLRGDLSQWVSRKSLFDVVVFNPPYVPTDADELERARRERDIAASWAGGERGREVIDRALPDVRSVLVAGGVFYLVLEKLNVVDEVRELAVRCQFTRGDVVGKVVAGREVLYVFKFIAV